MGRLDSVITVSFALLMLVVSFTLLELRTTENQVQSSAWLLLDPLCPSFPPSGARLLTQEQLSTVDEAFKREPGDLSDVVSSAWFFRSFEWLLLTESISPVGVEAFW